MALPISLRSNLITSPFRSTVPIGQTQLGVQAMTVPPPPPAAGVGGGGWTLATGAATGHGLVTMRTLPRCPLVAGPSKLSSKSTM